MSFLKFENLKHVLYTDDKYSMETEHKNRRKTVTVRLVRENV